MAVTFSLTGGGSVAIDPEVVESFSVTAEGVRVRLITGSTQIVRAPYLQVLEQLALR